MRIYLAIFFASACLYGQGALDVVNVKDKGAAGNGARDDTAAIRLAVATAKPGGTVLFPCGTYRYSATITVPSDVTLAGQGSFNCSVLRPFLATGGAGIAYANLDQINTRRGGARDLIIQGPGGSPPAPGSIGIFLGGDPAGMVSPANYSANHQIFQNVTVSGWDTGIYVGNNAYNTAFFEVTIQGNNRGVYEPAGIVNSASNMDFHDGIFLGNYTCGVETDVGGGNWNYFGTQFEFNSAGICGNTVSAFFFGAHFENQADSGCSTCGPFISVNNTQIPYVKVGLVNCSGTFDSGPNTQMFLLNANRVTLNVNGFEAYSSGTTSEIFNVNVSQPYVTQIVVDQVTGDEANNITAVFNSSAPLQGLSYIVKPNATQQSGQQCLQCTAPDPGGAAITVGSAYAEHNTMATPPPAMVIKESATLTSKRASLWFGDWMPAQDINNSGTRDWGLFNNRTSKLYEYTDPSTGHKCISINCGTGYTNYSLSIPPDSNNVAQVMIQDGTSQAGVCQLVLFNNALGSAVTICKGAGVPSINANIGSIFLRADGTSNNAVYINETGGSGGWVPIKPSGAVTSVFGRTGAVTAQSADYSFSQIAGTIAATGGQITGLATIATAGAAGGGLTCPMGQHVNTINLDALGTLAVGCN